MGLRTCVAFIRIWIQKYKLVSSSERTSILTNLGLIENCFCRNVWIIKWYMFSDDFKPMTSLWNKIPGKMLKNIHIFGKYNWTTQFVLNWRSCLISLFQCLDWFDYSLVNTRQLCALSYLRNRLGKTPPEFLSDGCLYNLYLVSVWLCKCVWSLISRARRFSHYSFSDG